MHRQRFGLLAAFALALPAHQAVAVSLKVGFVVAEFEDDEARI
ncbi:MAG: hypothetical protein JWL84_1757 [Rhodospirillales bacterium]|jgi:hypothetical protein|nr:hypothetical protein [Rhodospirillales bacterium]